MIKPPLNIASLLRTISDLSTRLSSLEEQQVVLTQAHQALQQKCLALSHDNICLKAENQQLKAENQQLRAQLAQNSRNSHRPPSSDGLKKPACLPKVSKKRGGQVGHKGKTLCQVPIADEFQQHIPSQCSCCARPFHLEEVETWLQKRQVFDLPVPRLVITEHQIGQITCCGQVQTGQFPAQVTAPVQYGHRVKALVTLWNVEYRLPFAKVRQLFKDIYGYAINDSTQLSAQAHCYQALVPAMNTIQAALRQEEVVHFDETGLRVTGKNQWLHTACSPRLCYLFVHPKRGQLALKSAVSLLKDFNNWAVHDCWASYFKFEDCQHALCNAHLLRELQALQEQGRQWATQMIAYLLELYETTQQGKGQLAAAAVSKWEMCYLKLLDLGDQEEPLNLKKKGTSKKGRVKQSKGRNLLERFKSHQTAILAFALHTVVPFTNNLAEQAVRHAKIKQKVAMSFRTNKGADWYARIQSFIITTRKQQQGTFQELVQILKGKKYSVKTTS